MTEKRLSGKVVVITRGGRGLNRSFAEVFAQERAKIVVVPGKRQEIDEMAEKNSHTMEKQLV
jgi:NAD(P)-dependent dehydrogenase (short-subunit alcohol dehydrogenase family)